MNTLTIIAAAVYAIGAITFFLIIADRPTLAEARVSRPTVLARTAMLALLWPAMPVMFAFFALLTAIPPLHRWVLTGKFGRA